MFHNRSGATGYPTEIFDEPGGGRNPKTGVVAPVTARKVVTFKGSEKLKAEVGGE